jgi:hypothetical protein
MPSITLKSRFIGLLLALTVLALLGALFAPDGRWLGVDVGATSHSLYVFALAGLVWQVSADPEALFPAEWSIAERRGWVSVFFGAMIVVWFAHFMWHASHYDPVPTKPYEFEFRHLGFSLIVLLIAWTVTHIQVGARQGGAVELDERDLRIRHAAVRFGDTLLCVTVVACVVLLATLPGEWLTWWLAPLITAHLLIGLLICKSLAENLWLVLSYARERA